ncbi:MAG: hypothetical protein GY795_14925, partial [Desulfobacterales bacterium]|nr:hypothetical protein [Desulfobacterales bacterium]
TTKDVLVNVTNLKKVITNVPDADQLLKLMHPSGIENKGIFDIPQFSNIIVKANKTSGSLTNEQVTLSLTPKKDYV